MKLTLFWLVTIIIGSLFLGIAAEYWGRNCETCMEQRRKWFKWFYKNDNIQIQPSLNSVEDDPTGSIMKMV